MPTDETQQTLYSEFSTESGLFTDYDGLVTGVWCQVDEYGRTNVHLEIQLLDPEQAAEKENGMVEEKFSVGNKWKSVDGTTLEHVDGSTKAKINTKSQYGRLIEAATALGAVPEMARHAESEGLVFTARDPRVWVGTKWHFAEFTSEYTTQDEKKEVRKSVKNLPDKFLGIGEVAQTAAWERMVDADQRERLSAIAAASDSNDAFVSAAIEHGWVTSNGQLLGEITSGSVYKSLTS